MHKLLVKQLHVIAHCLMAIAACLLIENIRVWDRSAFKLCRGGLPRRVNGNIISDRMQTLWGTLSPVSAISTRDVYVNILHAHVSLIWKVWRPHFTGNCCLVSTDVLLGRQVFEQSVQNVLEQLQSFLLIYPRKGQCCADVKATACLCNSKNQSCWVWHRKRFEEKTKFWINRLACLYQVTCWKTS